MYLNPLTADFFVSLSWHQLIFLHFLTRLQILFHSRTPGTELFFTVYFFADRWKKYWTYEEVLYIFL